VTATKTPQLSASTVEPKLTPEGPRLKGSLWGSERPLVRGVVRLHRSALRRLGGVLRDHCPGGIEGGRGS
jgi:hypothetical protein